jgi:hypothetical protein
MSKIKETTIEKITYKGSQSISFREIYKLDEKRIKLEIKSDSYDQQCYARASILKDEKWEMIYSIPYSEMNTPKGLCYHVTYRSNAAAAEKEFKSDIDRLKKYVKEILF